MGLRDQWLLDLAKAEIARLDMSASELSGRAHNQSETIRSLEDLIANLCEALGMPDVFSATHTCRNCLTEVTRARSAWTMLRDSDRRSQLRDAMLRKVAALKRQAAKGKTRGAKTRKARG